jgi:hypothetical protein
MSNPVNLAVLLAEDALWPALQALAHWHLHAGPVRRLCVCQVTPATGSSGAQRLARFARDQFPGLRVELREAAPNPAAARTHLDAWHRTEPDAAWILVLPDAQATVLWAADGWIGRPGCQVISRGPSGTWFELRRDPDGRPDAVSLADLRRDDTDALSVAHLLRACIPAESPPPLGVLPAQPLPVVRLTEAALAREWRWREAFAALELAPATDQEPEPEPFERYIAALLLALGARELAHTRRATPPASPPAVPETALWINRGGRLILLDLDASSPTAGDPATPGAAIDAIQRTARLRREFSGLPIDAILVRPCHRFTAAEAALARTCGLRFYDETAGPDLPTRLAQLLDLPLAAEGAEVERILRHHLATTGHTRVFGEQPVAVRQQGTAAADPAIASVEGWLDQLQRDRGQNWLAWSHDGLVHVRLPADHRAEAPADWQLLVAVVAGVDPKDVRADLRDKAVVLTFAAVPEVQQRLAAWFRPFLNGPLTFDAARHRLAAEARIHEQTAALPTPPAPAPGASPAAKRPAPTPPRPAAPAPPPARPAPQPSRRPTRRVDLSDLDQALNDALGGQEQGGGGR